MRWASKLFVENIIELLEEIDFSNFKKIKRDLYYGILKIIKIEVPFIIKIKYMKNSEITEEEIRNFFIDINTIKFSGKPLFIGYPKFSKKAIETAKKLEIITISVDELLDNLVDTSHYRNSIQQSNIETNYIKLDLISDTNNTIKLPVFLRLLRRNTFKQIIIKGESGAGKTTLLKYILFKEAQNPNMIPILIDLKEYRNGSFHEFIINEGFKKNNIKIKSEKIFHILCREKKLLFLFDNLEAVFNINQSNFYKEFEQILESRTPIIFTANTKFMADNYYSNFTLNKIIASYKPQIFSISHLTLSDIKKKLKASSLQKLLQNPTISELIKLPVFFDIITKISVTEETTINKPTDIYKEALNQWKTNYLTPLGKATLCEEMAKIIIEKGVFDSKKDMPDFIESFINNEYKRMPFSIEFVNRDLENSFFIKKISPNHYTFIHSSFTHFFLAKKLVEEIRRGNYTNIKLLHSKFILEFVKDYLGVDKIINTLIETYNREKFSKDKGEIFYLMYKVCSNLNIPAEIPVNKMILQKIDLILKEFVNIKISNCNLKEVILKAAELRNCKILNTDFTGSNMERIVIIDSEIKSSTFSFTNMKTSKIIRANLSNSSFHKANLFQSIIIKSNLSSTSFNSASLHGVIGAESIFKKVDILKTDLSNADFAKASFTEATMEEINSKSVSFCYADMSKITIKDSSFLFSFFHKTNFTGSNLFNVVLEAINLEGSIFNDADLNTVSFKWSNLQNASFKNSILKNVNFESADLRGADFTGAKMCDKTKESLKKALL